jgi:hypothetical protein
LSPLIPARRDHPRCSCSLGAAPEAAAHLKALDAAEAGAAAGGIGSRSCWDRKPLSKCHSHVSGKVRSSCVGKGYLNVSGGVTLHEKMWRRVATRLLRNGFRPHSILIRGIWATLEPRSHAAQIPLRAQIPVGSDPPARDRAHLAKVCKLALLRCALQQPHVLDDVGCGDGAVGINRVAKILE